MTEYIKSVPTKYVKSLPDLFQKSPFNDNVRKNRKEKRFNHSMILLAVNQHGGIQVLVDARFYHTDTRSYCCVWVCLPNFYLAGGAFAGGLGYHRDSASLQFALNDAGIEVTDLEGRGDGPMERCLIELGEKLNDQYFMGLTSFTVIEAHA